MADPCIRGFPGVMPHVWGNSDRLSAPRWGLKFVFFHFIFIPAPSLNSGQGRSFGPGDADGGAAGGVASSDATKLGESDWSAASSRRPRRSRRREEKKKKQGGGKSGAGLKNSPTNRGFTSDVVGGSAASGPTRCRSAVAVKETGEYSERINAHPGGRKQRGRS